MTDGVLSAAEEAAMKATFKATMLRAADILDWISDDDVLNQQAKLLASGMSLEKVARLDRARVGANYLRACAMTAADKDKMRERVKESLSTERKDGK